MGNPEYGADSKTITDCNEINEFIEVFNNGHLGGTISDDDIAIGGASTYSFYKDDEVIQTFSFNVNDTKIVWHDDKWRDVVYPENTLIPFDLYKQSQGEQNIVDLDENEMDLIRYFDDTYVKSELPQEVVEWLENYNKLSYEEQISISSAPNFDDTKPLGYVENDDNEITEIPATQDAIAD